MASELLLPTARATDNNANPYSGAKWYFYASGTSTPQNVYSNSTLATSLGSTVTADSAGKFVPIYFDANLQYRGVLKNASGSVTLHDIDPINSGILSLLASGDATLGGSLVNFVNGIDVGNPNAFGYADDDLARIYLARGLPTSIQHTFRVITSSKGDNTTYRGATNAYFEWRDADDVDSTNKGVGYALHLSVVPKVGRNNVPYDDVAALTIGNTTGTTSAKATDAIYISENPLFTVAGTSEWYSIFSADCKADVGYQVRFQPSTKKVARFPNDSYIYFNTATDGSLGSDRIGLGLYTDGALILGDSASPRVDIRPPVNVVNGGQVAGGWNINSGYLALGAPVVSSAATYTIGATTNGVIFNGSGCTVTLPTAGSYTGRTLYLKTTVAFTVISASSNVVPLVGGAAGTAILAATAGKWALLWSDGANWQVMAGN